MKRRERVIERYCSRICSRFLDKRSVKRSSEVGGVESNLRSRSETSFVSTVHCFCRSVSPYTVELLSGSVDLVWRSRFAHSLGTAASSRFGFSSLTQARWE